MLPAGLTLHLCNLTFNKDSTQGKLHADFPCLVISSLLRPAKPYFCLLTLMRLLSPLQFHYPKCASKQKSRDHRGSICFPSLTDQGLVLPLSNV